MLWRIDLELSVEGILWQIATSGAQSNVESYKEKISHQSSRLPLLLRGATEHTVIRVQSQLILKLRPTPTLPSMLTDKRQRGTHSSWMMKYSLRVSNVSIS